jgi:hypothetical protein
MRKLWILIAAGAVIASAGISRATPVGTAFSYQGQLKENGGLYAGSADFIFRLYDAESGGTQIGADQNLSAVQVDAGVFQVSLDFGAGAFGGDARWIEIWAKASSDQNYTQLTPRQPCLPSPYAVYATGAPGGGGGGPWVQNGPDLTYPTGSVGVTGASSPFAGGKGLFFEGGNTSFASLWAFDYDTYLPLNLSLNLPGGNVGIGTSTPNAKLRIYSGTADINPLWVTNNNAAFAALYVQNLAANSYGLYDDTSTKHYLAGSLGVGTLSPQAAIHAVGGEAIRGEGSGVLHVAGVGVHGIGGGNFITGYAVGVLGEATHNFGVEGTTGDVNSYGGYFKNTAGGTALFADGPAKVRTLQILGGADLAERFDVDPSASAEPGTVMMIDEKSPGQLRVSDRAYCRCVAGVVSGAQHLSAGVVLGTKSDAGKTAPVALSGRVWVRCDNSGGVIQPGDLLTTSSHAGYAMKATDDSRLSGAVLGKAMSSLDGASGMVLVLVSLQ